MNKTQDLSQHMKVTLNRPWLCLHTCSCLCSTVHISTKEEQSFSFRTWLYGDVLQHWGGARGHHGVWSRGHRARLLLTVLRQRTYSMWDGQLGRHTFQTTMSVKTLCWSAESCVFTTCCPAHDAGEQISWLRSRKSGICGLPSSLWCSMQLWTFNNSCHTKDALDFGNTCPRIWPGTVGHLWCTNVICMEAFCSPADQLERCQNKTKDVRTCWIWLRGWERWNYIFHKECGWHNAQNLTRASLSAPESTRERGPLLHLCNHPNSQLVSFIPKRGKNMFF